MPWQSAACERSNLIPYHLQPGAIGADLPPTSVASVTPTLHLPTLLSHWEELVRAEPAALAVIDGASGRRWTRAELDAAATAWRQQIPGNSLARRRVLLTEPNGIGWWQAFLGLLRAGAIPAAGDPTEPLATQRTVATAIGAAALGHDGQLELLPDPRPTRSPREACLIKLTSGSTGTPKALVFTHAQMIADGRQVCAAMGITPGDLNLAVIPLGHSYGLGNLVVPLLVQGTPMVCAASPLPSALAEDCARWQPTVFPAVPTLLRALARTELRPGQLDCLRLVISAGAPLTPEIAAAFLARTGRRVHGFYGSSETGGISFDADGEATLTGRSVGRPFPSVRLHFRRGRRFAVSSAAVRGLGRFSPPDYGTLNAHGELVLQGRSGRTVKIGGRRLSLGEVETALLALPGVRAACALPHPSRVDHVAAVVETDLSGAELRAALALRLAGWKIPDRLVAVPQLPLTARGKIDRARAAALAISEQR